MAEAQHNAPRFLREPDNGDQRQPAPDRSAGTPTTATVDVMDLLARLTARTEEAVDATVRVKHAEAEQKKQKREFEAERKAHNRTRRELDDERKQRQNDRAQLDELQAELDRERKIRFTLEDDLKSAEERAGALEHQVQLAWSQLQSGEAKPEARSRWRR